MNSTFAAFGAGLAIGVAGTALMMWNNFKKGIKAKLAEKLQDGASRLNN